MLLDTHILIWHATADRKLSRKAAKAIRSGGNRYSHVTLWELATKSALKTISLAVEGKPATARDFVLAASARLQLAPVPIELDDLAGVGSLPLHHRDPFDRILIVQALRRGLPIVSADPIFDKYGVSRVW